MKRKVSLSKKVIYNELAENSVNSQFTIVTRLQEDEAFDEIEVFINDTEDLGRVAALADIVKMANLIDEIEVKKEGENLSVIFRDLRNDEMDDMFAFYLSKIIEWFDNGEYIASLNDSLRDFFVLIKTAKYSRKDIRIEYDMHAGEFIIYRPDEIPVKYEKIEDIEKILVDHKYSYEFDNTGQAIRDFIPEEKMDEATRNFSEGRKSLEELLFFCMKNRLRTFSCCAGHELIPGTYTKGYVSFALENDELMRNIVLTVFSKLFENDMPVRLDFSVRSDDVDTEKRLESATIYINGRKEDEVFTYIREVMQEILLTKKFEINPFILDMYNVNNRNLNTSFSYSVSKRTFKCSELKCEGMSFEDARKWLDDLKSSHDGVGDSDGNR